MAEPLINHVADTALWVAVYRAEETERANPIFRDPFARRLTGDRGRKIAANMSQSRYVGWSVIMRTSIIDRYIQELVSGGVDTIVNLGAGLDTRPYRMDLPENLNWIEVDYPHMMRFKDEELAAEKPKCKLERVRLDLADREARQRLFSRIAGQSKKVLILTEGVTPYLTEDQVGTLADDLRAQPKFAFWITDHFSKMMQKITQTGARKKQMKNAPFVFYPENWAGFYSGHGWKIREERFLWDESDRVKRPFPAPWFVKLLMNFAPPEKKAEFRKFQAYVLLEPKEG